MVGQAQCYSNRSAIVRGIKGNIREKGSGGSGRVGVGESVCGKASKLPLKVRCRIRIGGSDGVIMIDDDEMIGNVCRSEVF